MTLAEQLQENLTKLKKVDKMIGKEEVNSQVNCVKQVLKAQPDIVIGLRKFSANKRDVQANTKMRMAAIATQINYHLNQVKKQKKKKSDYGSSSDSSSSSECSNSDSD